MAGFIQLVEFETDDIDRVENAIRKFRDDHPDVMKFTFSRVGEDRDKPGTYISIVEFPSYETAMEQSNHPALSEFVQSSEAGMMANRRFRNLDVRSEI